MTKEAFEQGYAERSNLTIEQLHELGLKATPCDCDDPHCQGWAIIFSEE